MPRILPYLKYIFIRPQKISIESIPDGSVIDIGGGGEGIIAQIGNERITAIDKHQSEIDEAKPNAPKANWILADASALSYSDDYFDNATAFFSGMYMSEQTLEEVFKEVYRVLKTGGEFWIWDAIIKDNKELFIIRLTITLPDGTKVRTGYGSRLTNRRLPEITQLLEKSNFSVSVIEDNEKWFFLKADKS